MGWGTWAGSLLLLGTAAGLAHAQSGDIFKCVDADGKRHYTNSKKETAGMKCEQVSSQINVAPAKPPSGRFNFPKESPSDRASAKERQRQILEKELATEEQALAKAKQELAAQEAVRGGDERNYQRVLDRLQPYKESVENHEKNIAALKRELTNLSR